MFFVCLENRNDEPNENMTLPCPSCQSPNSADAQKCSVCGISLVLNPEEIYTLRFDLQILKKEFQGKIQNLEQKIALLENQLAFLKLKSQTDSQPEKPIEKPYEKPIPKTEQPKVTQVPLSVPKIDVPPITERPVPPPKEKVKIPKPERTEPTFLEEVLFIPFEHFKDLAVQTYTHYKEQNKLPVFLMSLGGIAALLLGFGYLLQYTSTYFLEIFKIAFTVFSVAFLIFWGIKLPQKNEKFKEFGSALLGLGISLNYLVIYFLSNSAVFVWGSYPVVSFALIIFNTLLASWLALRYETKIVVVLSLLGGALAPYYLNVPVSGFYLVYLWVLTLATILIAQKIKWEWAGILAFAVVSLVLESIVFQPNNFVFSLFAQNLILFGFGYLFLYYTFFDGLKIKETLKAREILILAANVSLILANCFAIYENAGLRQTAGYIYLANALVFIVLFLVFRQKLSRQMQALLWVLAGTFVGFAVPVAFDQRWSGLFWSVEAVALIYCGFLFRFSTVRYEGYLVLLFALGKMALTFPVIFLFWQTQLWTEGFINALVLIALSAVLVILFRRNSENSKDWEKYIGYGAFESLALALAFAFFVFSMFQFRDWGYPTAILGLYFFIFMGKKYKLPLTELLGWAHFAWLGFGFLASFQQAENGMTLLSFQPPFGKATIILTFLSVGFLQVYYQKVLPKLIPDLPPNESPTVIFWTQILNSLFFLAIPIAFLPSVNFFYPNYLPLATWGSVMVAFVLYEFTQKREILIELHLIIVAATVFVLITMDNFAIAQMTILGSLVWFVFIFLFRKGYSKTAFATSPYQLIFSYSFYYLGFCIFLVVLRWGIANADSGLSFLATALYFAVLVFWHKKIVALHNNAWLAFRFSQVLLTIIAFIFFNASFWIAMNQPDITATFLVFVVLYLLIYRLAGSYPAENQKSRVFDLYWVHIVFALMYSNIISSFLPEMNGIVTVLLILQAIVILFNSAIKIYKPLTYLSIGFFVLAVIKLYTQDLVNFTEVQKVIVLMVIGVLMLLSAYLFVKFKERIEK